MKNSLSYIEFGIHNNEKIKFQIINEKLNITLNNNILIYEGNLALYTIQNQMRVFKDFNIYEILYVINDLKAYDFTLQKENENKYKLEINFLVFRIKKQQLYIDLYHNNKEKYIKCISELNEKIIKKDEVIKKMDEENKEKDKIIKEKDEIIKEKDKIIKEKDKIIKEKYEIIKEKNENIKEKEDIIKLMNDQFNKYKNDEIKNIFNIELKEPINILNNHSGCINCLTILKDGRLVSCSNDNSIIIYNKSTYKPDLIIKEHKDSVSSITSFKSGI